jgi:plasmid stabilization system protein ParE
MAEIKWTPQAADDLESIANFIAKDSPNYARLFVIDVLDAVDRLVVFPQSGRIVPELKNQTIREVIKGHYRIVYRFKAETVEVLTVHHGARLLGHALREENL